MKTKFVTDRLAVIKEDRVTNAVASQGLCAELLGKIGDDKYAYNFNYTNYGGTLIDKAMIAFANKYYPNCIVSENTSWNGENAFVFGELARIIDESDCVANANYKADFEEFYMNMVSELENDAFTNISTLFTDSELVYDWLRENKSGYYNCEPNFLDYNEDEVIKELQDEGFNLKEE